MAGGRQARILVIDDDEAILRIIEVILGRAGYEVQLARNGMEGLNEVTNFKPDLLLLDVVMPLMKGTEVSRRLREQPTTARLPIIMMSNLGEIDDKLEGFEAGADDYVTKPVNARELLARIKALLTRADFGRQRIARTIAVVGVKGGVGVSSLVVNLGAALNQREQVVRLAEFPSYGSILRYLLNIPAGPDITTLAALPPDKLDNLAVRKSLVAHESGVQVLLAPESEAVELAPEQVEVLLRLLERDADFLLLDVPPVDSPAVRRILELADHILLVTEADLLSAICTRGRLAQFHDRGYGHRTDVVAISRVPSGLMMARVELENEIGMAQDLPTTGSLGQKRYDAPAQVAVERIVAMIPAAPEAFHDAVRAGVPLISLDPSVRAAHAIAELAEWLLEELG